MDQDDEPPQHTQERMWPALLAAALLMLVLAVTLVTALYA